MYIPAGSYRSVGNVLGPSELMISDHEFFYEFQTVIIEELAIGGNLGHRDIHDGPRHGVDDDVFSSRFDVQSH